MAESRAWMPQPERRLDGCVVCEAAPEEAGGETIVQRANGAAQRNPGSDIAVAVTAEAPPRAGCRRCAGRPRPRPTAATASALRRPGDRGGPRACMRGFPDRVPAPPRSGHRGRDPSRAARAARGTRGRTGRLLRRGPFDLLGGLDESLPTSAAALADYSLRAREQGLAERRLM